MGFVCVLVFIPFSNFLLLKRKLMRCDSHWVVFSDAVSANGGKLDIIKSYLTVQHFFKVLFCFVWFKVRLCRPAVQELTL